MAGRGLLPQDHLMVGHLYAAPSLLPSNANESGIKLLSLVNKNSDQPTPHRQPKSFRTTRGVLGR
jgi:hypothetical protein